MKDKKEKEGKRTKKERKKEKERRKKKERKKKYEKKVAGIFVKKLKFDLGLKNAN